MHPDRAGIHLSQAAILSRKPSHLCLACTSLAILC